MTWNGNSGVTADQLTLVFNSLVLNGNTTWKLTRHPQWSFGTPAGSGNTQPKNVLKAVKLRQADR